jgi:hypothetical protein
MGYGSIPFAFSVHHFINSVGADAGFAALVGLAILILLYFAQARETSALREHAYEAAQRVQQLEARLAYLTRMQGAPPQQGTAVAPAPAGAGGPVAQPAPGRAAAAALGVASLPIAAVAVAPTSASSRIPAAPAGVAAPALTAATKLIPTPDFADAVEPIQVPFARPAAADAIAAGALVAGAATAAASPAVVAELPVPVAGGPPIAPGPPIAAGPPPATAAGGNGAGAGHLAADAPVGVVAAAPVSAEPPSPLVPLSRGGFAAPPRRPAGRSPHDAAPAAGSRFSGRRWVIAALTALAVAAAAVVALVVSSSGGSKPNHVAAATSRPQTTRRGPRPSAVDRAAVSVAVLNGTATSGLAGRISQQLSGDGYKVGAQPADAADQTHATTTVGYAPGARSDALAVARSLKLGPSSVAPIDSGTQAIACGQTTGCNINVIVTVGADLASGA